ncbi:hypothetical protein MMC30_002343 [Trapelia coarctata]|nr:hypothetical protein [Trapelia coarctata]
MSIADNRVALLGLAVEKRSSLAYRDGVQSLLTSGKYHDFVICCGDRSWKVHRAIICSQSKYFTGICDGDFKKSHENKIDLQGDDPKLVEQMVLFLYTARYPAPLVEKKQRAEQDLITDARLYALADKFDIPALKHAVVAAFTKLLHRVSTDEGTTPMTFLTELVPIVYESTPDSDRQLREPLQVFFRSCPWTVLGRKSVMEYAREHTNFAYDILVHIVKGNKTYHKYRYWCMPCSGYDVGDGEGRCKKCLQPLEEFQ